MRIAYAKQGEEKDQEQPGAGLGVVALLQRRRRQPGSAPM